MGSPSKTLRSIRVLKNRLDQSGSVGVRKALDTGTLGNQSELLSQRLVSLADKIQEVQKVSRKEALEKHYRKVIKLSPRG